MGAVQVGTGSARSYVSQWGRIKEGIKRDWGLEV